MNSNRIICMGDFHASSRTPSSRIDDYAEAALGKLVQIMDIANKEGIPTIVHLGDWFNIREQPWAYYNKIVHYIKAGKALFKHNWKTELKFFTIIGNRHDLPYDSIEYLPRTPLGGLIETGTLERLEEYKIGDVTLIGQSIGELETRTFKKKPQDCQKSILFLHHFYQQQWDDPYFISKEDCLEIGHDAYVLGHDHTPYATLKLDNGSLVVRPGSVMRGSSHRYQIIRDVRVQIFNLDLWNTEERKLSIADSSVVFSNKSLGKDKRKPFSMLDAVQFVEKVMSSNNDTKESVFGLLDAAEMEPEVRYYIEQKLSENGVYRDRI